MEKYYQGELETAGRDEMQSLQSERLRSTVARVYENVPFYRERMKAAGVTPGDIGGAEDLSKLAEGLVAQGWLRLEGETYLANGALREGRMQLNGRPFMGGLGR